MKKINLLFLLLPLLISCSPDKHDKNHLITDTQYSISAMDSLIWWYPWNQQAINYAKKNDKLIFLNIGYSTCQSCNKFFDEVLQNQSIVEKLNGDFVSIRVDALDRPEINNFFMQQQSLIMGFGGWPINFILTPDFKPVYVVSSIRSPEFLKILNKVTDSWDNNREKMMSEINQFIQNTTPQQDHLDYFSKDFKLIEDYYAKYTHQFDPLFGGKGQKPNFRNKFLISNDMRLLMRFYQKTKTPQTLKMIEKTMSTVAKSALFDHINGGVFKYSLSRNWNTPHLEKSLSDQASFLHSYIDLYQLKPNDLYRNTIEKTVRYIFNLIKNPLGGFYSSQLYSKESILWKPNEIQSYLSSDELKIFNDTYTVNNIFGPDRNFRILHKKTVFVNDNLKEIEENLSQLKLKQSKILTEKIITTASSSYMYSALARFSKLWPNIEFLDLLTKHFNLFLTQHQSLNQELYHRSINGAVKHEAHLDDYAFTIDALIEMYQSTFNQQYLQKALHLQQQQIQKFYIKTKNQFQYTTSPKPFKNQFILQDIRLPSAQSISYWNLLRLSRYFKDKDMEQMAIKLIDSYPDTLKTNPLPYTQILLAQSFQLSEKPLLVIRGNNKECLNKLNEISQLFFPDLIIACSSNKLPTTKIKPIKQYMYCKDSDCQNLDQLNFN